MFPKSLSTSNSFRLLLLLILVVEEHPDNSVNHAQQPELRILEVLDVDIEDGLGCALASSAMVVVANTEDDEADDGSDDGPDICTHDVTFLKV